ncbi:gfo/Idh/MocA family oxidoreductase [Paenibacillaceae bacterium]|nr:gfo/Idh/MocA family oxidoreductase [Paenibacillaceae bacterium]
MNKELRIGMIGLDTSHCGLFTSLLNDSAHEHHVPGGRVTLAYPGGSADLQSSHSRVGSYTAEMKEKYGVDMADTLEEVADRTDAIFLTSVDGRVHLEQFAQIASYGKPVYINKPFALSVREAETIFELADRHKVALMSCSSLRYADEITQSLLPDERGEVIGADAFSPMPLEPTNPGWYWYGIHAVEMLFTAMPTGCRKIQAYKDARSECVIGVWDDGRIGTVRGNRVGNHDYGITVHREQGSIAVNPLQGKRPFHVHFVEELMKMFQTGICPLDPAITMEITRFMEAANESRISGTEIKI